MKCASGTLIAERLLLSRALILVAAAAADRPDWTAVKETGVERKLIGSHGGVTTNMAKFVLGADMVRGLGRSTV